VSIDRIVEAPWGLLLHVLGKFDIVVVVGTGRLRSELLKEKIKVYGKNNSTARIVITKT